MTYRRKIASHSEDWWAIVAPITAVRCEGHTRDGNRCRREAHPGATVCRIHGGAAPQVRQRAAARIGNAADEMVRRLQAMLDDPNVDARDKIKIAQDLLDRAGLNAVEKHIVGVGEVDPVEALFRNILGDPSGLAPAQPLPPEPDPKFLAYARAADPQSLLDDDEDVVEAEVVEDDAVEVVTTTPPTHIQQAIARVDKMLDGRWK